jgi:hypothetical protein
MPERTDFALGGEVLLDQALSLRRRCAVYCLLINSTKKRGRSFVSK